MKPAVYFDTPKGYEFKGVTKDGTPIFIKVNWKTDIMTFVKYVGAPAIAIIACYYISTTKLPVDIKVAAGELIGSIVTSGLLEDNIAKKIVEFTNKLLALNRKKEIPNYILV